MLVWTKRNVSPVELTNERRDRNIVEEFLSHADVISDDILEDSQKMLGIMPFILPVLRERPEYFALSSLADEMICRPGCLSPKIAELVSLAAAASSGADSCMNVRIRAAVREGVTRDEIYDTIMIAALIGKTWVLGPALREFCEVFPTEPKDRQE